jgi:biopolymer transport protein ExbD
MYFSKKSRRSTINLNVTALIDISALIIIFLIMGSVFGESSLSIPPNMMIPKSTSKENVENAPSVTISDTGVKASFNDDVVPLEWFHQNDDRLKDYQSKVSKFVTDIPSDARTSGVLLNIIADAKTPYRDIFDVIRVFRTAGFQSVLFIAQGK